MRPFKISDILMANQEVYKMVGSFGGDQTIAKGGSDMDASLLILANPDLFTKKCLYPLQSATP